MFRSVHSVCSLGAGGGHQHLPLLAELVLVQPDAALRHPLGRRHAPAVPQRELVLGGRQARELPVRRPRLYYDYFYEYDYYCYS